MPAYFSEILYEGGSGNFIEIAVPAGTDTSAYSVATYTGDGDLRATFPLGAVRSTSSGYDVYVIDASAPGFYDLAPNNGFALVDDTGTVVQFLGFDKAITAKEGPANGQRSTAFGDNTASTQSAESNDGGASYQAQSSPSPGTIPNGPPVCYAFGTLIDTPDGPRAVDTLKPGDLVMTLDHGPQAIRWTRSGDHLLEDAEDDAKPVQIKAGALGRNLPAQDLIVSPQHRILVGGAGQLDGVFASEAFAPAKSLTGAPGIRHMKGKAKITWVHFACARHEVVKANGCQSESLLLGPMVVNGLSVTEREALIALFGPSADPDKALNGPPARECLTVDAVRCRLAKYLKEKGALVAKETGKWDRDLAMEKHETERLRVAKSLIQYGDSELRVA